MKSAAASAIGAACSHVARFSAAMALGLAALVGCVDRKSPSADAGSSLPEPSAPASYARPTFPTFPTFPTLVEASTHATTNGTPTRPSPAREDTPCRIVEASGSLSGGDAGATLHVGAVLVRGAVLDLAPSAVATVKDGESGRELRLEGPARVIPCAATDEAWLLRGTLSMRPGSADQPFQELSVVVREGVIHLSGGAVVRVEAAPGGTRVVSRARRPQVWIPKEAKMTWEKGDAGNMEVGTISLAKGATAAAANAECGTLARESRELGAKMLAGDASLAELSPRSIEASRNERAACSVARLVKELEGRANPR